MNKAVHSVRFFSLLLACYLFQITSTLAAQPPAEAFEDSPENYKEQVFTWESSRPTVTDFDWVQLTSGEWLKGEIKGLYKDSLEFDSDNLDDLTIDWEDVKYVETHIPGAAYIEYYGRVYGYFKIDQKTITVINGDSVQEFDRSRLLNFITGGEKEKDYWSIKLTLGLNVRSGNTDQVDYNAKVNMRRQTSFSRLILDYIGNISQTSDIETSNNHRLNVTHDIFKTRRFFFRPIFGEYFRDPFQNIDSKITVGTGLGYTIVDTKRVEWDVAGGPAYQATRFVTVEAGENLEEDTLAIVLGTHYEVEATSKIDFIYDYNITWGNEESGGYTHHMVATFENEITGSFDLDISLVWDHISNPTAADDGVIPLEDDYRLTLGISYEY